MLDQQGDAAWRVAAGSIDDMNVGGWAGNAAEDLDTAGSPSPRTAALPPGGGMTPVAPTLADAGRAGHDPQPTAWSLLIEPTGQRHREPP